MRRRISGRCHSIRRGAASVSDKALSESFWSTTRMGMAASLLTFMILFFMVVFLPWGGVLPAGRDNLREEFWNANFTSPRRPVNGVI